LWNALRPSALTKTYKASTVEVRGRSTGEAHNRRLRGLPTKAGNSEEVLKARRTYLLRRLIGGDVGRSPEEGQPIL
jgi:hypothetical protein